MADEYVLPLKVIEQLKEELRELRTTGRNDIAEKMFISNKTVSTYKSRLMEKLECKSLMDLYTFAQRNKIG